MWQVYRSDPLKLLKSENTGEKPPKGNVIGFILGSVILGAAYFIAVSIKKSSGGDDMVFYCGHNGNSSVLYSSYIGFGCIVPYFAKRIKSIITIKSILYQFLQWFIV